MKEIPNHVAIIMDGNGRWALNKGLTRSLGHEAGSKTLENLASYIFKKGVKVLSVYAFSIENFKRSKEEVDYLMNLFLVMFKTKLKTIKSQNIKIVFSKKEFGLPKNLEKVIKEIEEETKNNTNGIFNICINYSFEQEMIDTIKKINKLLINKEITIDDIDANLISKNLYQDLPPIDLLIRTSGEYRLSNFMMWQLIYSEMYFTNTLFPDFNEQEFDEAVLTYQKRDRRFGGVKSK